MRFPPTQRPCQSILVALLFLITPFMAAATCHVITPSGAGSTSGADWDNACAGFTGVCAPGSLVRGDTYHVGKGNYSSVTFPLIAGTTPIVIQAATVAAHCTDTGFVAGTHVGQAVFSAQVRFVGDYITFDGSYRGKWGCSGPGCANDPTSYGFKVNNTNGNHQPIATGTAVGFGCNGSFGSCSPIRGSTGDRMLHTWVEGSGPTSSTGSDDECMTFETTDTNDYVGYSASRNCGVQHMRFQNTNNFIAEYDWLMNNAGGANGGQSHSESLNWQGCNTGTWTFRYNFLENGVGTGDMSTAAGGTPTGTCNWEIYGNVFFHNNAEPGSWPQPDGPWNGIFHWHDFTLTGNIKIYNNTFANYLSSSNNTNYSDFICQGEAVTGSGGLGLVGNADVKNNIFYYDRTVDQLKSCADLNTEHGTYNWDHNAYFGTNTTDSDSTRQMLGSNPFVNAPRDVANTDDYRLATDTAAWTPLAAPYNVDMFGVTRTSSRGAIQFTGAGAGGGAPAAPSGLSVNVH